MAVMFFATGFPWAVGRIRSSSCNPLSSNVLKDTLRVSARTLRGRIPAKTSSMQVLLAGTSHACQNAVCAARCGNKAEERGAGTAADYRKDASLNTSDDRPAPALGTPGFSLAGRSERLEPDVPGGPQLRSTATAARWPPKPSPSFHKRFTGASNPSANSTAALAPRQWPMTGLQFRRGTSRHGPASSPARS